MTDIALLGIRVESSQTEKAYKELDRLAVSAARADVAADKLGNTSGRKLAPGMAAGGHQSRMMAMQLSQVAQQASATGNWVQALAIQLPDMALGFGTIGIAAGVLAGATLPLLAGMFTETSGKAEAVTKSVEGLAEAADAYVAAAAAASISTEELAAKYGTLSAQARLALQAMADVTLIQAIDATNASIQAVFDSLIEIQTFSNGRQVAVLADDFGLASEQATNLRNALTGLQQASGLQAQAVAAGEVQRQLLAAYGSVQRMPPPLRAAYEQMAQIMIKTGEVKGAADQARNAFAQFPGLLNAASSAGGVLQGVVTGIATAAWDAAQAMAAMMDASSLEYGKVMNNGGVDAIARAGNAQSGVDTTGTAGTGAGGAFRPTGGGGGGGGGGGSDQFATDLQALIENLRSQREIEDEWYQENLTILQDRRAEEILGEQGHKEAMIALHQEYQNRIAEIDAEAQQRRLSDTANLFGALASVAQAGGQKMAKAVAVAQAIEGTINAYGAAIKALNTPGLTLAGRFAAYASVLAAGLKGVAAIRGAGGVGGGGGRSAVPAQGAQAGGNTIEYKVYGLDRDAMYSGAFFEKMWAGIYEEGKRRGVDTSRVTFV